MTRVLVAIPTYNERATIADVVRAVRKSAPNFDILVVDDGSGDGTGGVLQELNALVATHLCNLGYGRALQTAIKYAVARNYELLITFDADGQHNPEDIEPLYRRFVEADYDLLIGSRFVESRNYRAMPFARRLGMYVFSMLVRLLASQRIYDTTSGLKVIHRRVFGMLTGRPLVDFHAEVIVYLILRRYRVGEFPITVGARQHGASMYTWLSSIKYPLKISLLILLSVIETKLIRRHSHD